MSNICQKALYTIKTQTNEKLSKLSMSYYDTHSKGDLLSRFNNDLEAISSLFMQVIPKIFSYSITFVGTLIMMFYIDSILTIITLITLPLLAISSKFLLKFSKKKRTLYFQKLGQLNAIITESYLNQEIISLYNNDTSMKENFNQLNKDLAKTNLKATLITSLLSPLASLLNYLVYLLILVIGAKHVFDGKLKFGEIQSLIQYTKQLGTPINSSTNLLSQIQTSLIATNRIFDILDETEEKHSGTETLSSIKSIEFKNVDFSYTSEPLIKDLNIKINKGEKIAIVGESGSGKSTIINLLMQFYKINNGDILINNKSICKYNLNDYYNQISLVTQDLWLLNDTIKNNLKYGNLSVNEESILNICKKTNCLEIIDKMPDKLNEVIDENTQNISEGEKQLLTITRSLLKNHSLLILDEATSNVDSKTEGLIEETLKNISNDKITLIIAHRLSTIVNADKIIVMKDGKIIEAGTHNSLYKEKGEYYRFLQVL
jgi:ABC-type multidrug transport system fused ATPase/permease subunit